MPCVGPFTDFVLFNDKELPALKGAGNSSEDSNILREALQAVVGR
jgi:hypothetical protein